MGLDNLVRTKKFIILTNYFHELVLMKILCLLRHRLNCISRFYLLFSSLSLLPGSNVTEISLCSFITFSDQSQMIFLVVNVLFICFYLFLQNDCMSSGGDSTALFFIFLFFRDNIRAFV